MADEHEASGVAEIARQRLGSLRQDIQAGIDRYNFIEGLVAEFDSHYQGTRRFRREMLCCDLPSVAMNYSRESIPEQDFLLKTEHRYATFEELIYAIANNDLSVVKPELDTLLGSLSGTPTLPELVYVLEKRMREG